MDNEEKNIMDGFREAVMNELNNKNNDDTNEKEKIEEKEVSNDEENNDETLKNDEEVDGVHEEVKEETENTEDVEPKEDASKLEQDEESKNIHETEEKNESTEEEVKEIEDEFKIDAELEEKYREKALRNEEFDNTARVDELINNIQNHEENMLDEIISSNEEDGINNQNEYKLRKPKKVKKKKEKKHKENKMIDDEENNIKKNKNEKKKGSSLSIIIVFMILILIGVGGYLFANGYFSGNSNNKEKDNTTTTITKVIDPILDGTDNSNKELYIYYDTIVNQKDEDSEELIDIYDCKNDNCSGYNLEGSKINKLTNVIITDGEKIFLYDAKNKKGILDLTKIISNNQKVVALVYLDNNIVGLCVANESDKNAYYDLNLKKFVTEFKYGKFNILTKDILVAHTMKETYASDMEKLYDIDGNVINEDSVDVININDESILYHKEITNLAYYDALQIEPISDDNKGYNYYLESQNGHYEILDSDFKVILAIDTVKKTSEIDVPKPQILTNGTIFMNYGNKFIIYDLNGNQIYKSKIYNQFSEILDYDGYYVVTENNNLKIIDRVEKTITQFDDWNSNLEIVSAFNVKDINQCENETVIYRNKFSNWDLQLNNWCSLDTKTVNENCGIKDNGIYIKAISNNKTYIYYYDLNSKQTTFNEITDDSCLSMGI